MKNISDYFSNSDKESPNKDPRKDTIKRNSGTPKAISGKTENKKNDTSGKKKKRNCSNTNISSTNDSVDQNSRILQFKSNVVNPNLSDAVRYSESPKLLQINSSIVNPNELNVDERRYSESDDETKSEVKSDKKNAFKIMMESRNKSIGSNSPGKELLNPSGAVNECDKAKISARKKLLSEWADLKGSSKRKREEEEKEEIIKRKLEKRSKRMKKLLRVNKDSESSNDSVDMKIISKKRRNKVLRRLSCSSNSSIEGFEKEKIGNLDYIKAHKKSTDKIEEPKEATTDKIIIDDNESIIFVDENDKDVLNKENKKLKGTNSTLNCVSNEKQKKPPNNNHTCNTIIVDESSQDSLSTPPTLSSWRMKIKLNINENDVQAIGENMGEQKFSKVDLDEDTQDSVRLLSSDSDEEFEPISSKCKKIAPVFLQAAPKPKVDPEVLRARQEFLMSGTPSILKLKFQKQKCLEDKPFDEFPSISHIQQKCGNPFWNLPNQNILLQENSSYKPTEVLCNNLTNKNKGDKQLILKHSEVIIDIRSILNEIKANKPDYPVFKSFRLINEKSGRNLLQEKPENMHVKKKRGRPKKNLQSKPPENQDTVSPADYAMWTEKYKPKSADDIIGNAEALKKLKAWLETWKNLSQEIISKRSRKNSSSSEFETTDCDSRDNIRIPDNTIILAGPCGSGKTASVYAVCNQLGFNVIEMNASSKRTGRKLLQDLQEATQSYQVRKEEKGIQNLFNINKRKENCQELKTDEKMCVLLVEDVDIVFDQDDGFIIALQQLIATSKRPIILTTTDYSSNFSQKFLFDYECISFSPLQSSTLATWCQILCLVEGKYVNCDAIGSLIDYNKGDIRKTLLQLQFWVQSGGQLTQQTTPIKIEHLAEIVDEKIFEDEQLEGNEGNPTRSGNIFLHQDCLKSFEIFEHHEPFSVPYYLNLGFIWWNIPNIFDMRDFSKERINKLKLDNNLSEITKKEPTEKLISKETEKIKLRYISNFYESLSFADVMFRKYDYFDSSEPEIRNHTSIVRDSLKLDESFNTHKDLEFMHELTHTLVNGYVKLYNFDGSKEVKLDVGVPHKSEIRWRTKHHVCEDLYQESLPPCSYVERKSAFLDYYPILRNISRSEIQRAANNTKRGNRFRNYLKELGIKCSENNVKLACRMLRDTD